MFIYTKAVIRWVNGRMTSHSIMAGTDSAVVLLELHVQWD